MNKLEAENARLRERVERLRGALKSTSGWLMDAHDQTNCAFFLSCSEWCLDVIEDAESAKKV